jgi:hypothetical protein
MEAKAIIIATVLPRILMTAESLGITVMGLACTHMMEGSLTTVTMDLMPTPTMEENLGITTMGAAPIRMMVGSPGTIATAPAPAPMTAVTVGTILHEIPIIFCFYLY